MSKDKTVSFRVSTEKFRELRDIADERDLSLSALFRDYVDMLVAHEGKVEIVPGYVVEEGSDEPTSEFPPKVTVPTSFVREHERLELEAEHLRDQLDEYKQYTTRLKQELDDVDEDEEVIHLEDLDEHRDESEFHIG